MAASLSPLIYLLIRHTNDLPTIQLTKHILRNIIKILVSIKNETLFYISMIMKIDIYKEEENISSMKVDTRVTQLYLHNVFVSYNYY